MTQAHKLDREAVAADCRFITRSETEAIGLAKGRVKGIHGKGNTDEEPRTEHLEVV